MTPVVAIVAPPPTPNGDLHLGHLAGPYLCADVLRRYFELQGRRSVSALSVDLSQSYVVTTAERINVDPLTLAQRSHSDIQESLTAAEIRFDIVGMPDSEYAAYVQHWFERLHAAGIFDAVDIDIPFDARRGRFLFEAYASGWCPTCLSATKGNICEACGHPNNPARLLDVYPTGGNFNDPVEMRNRPMLVLDLERWREPLTRHLRDTFPELRPKLRRLVDELLAGSLPVFPITFPSTWGIPAPFPGYEGEVLNVWAEMVPGHYYWLERAHKAGGELAPLIGGDSPISYIQCLGFDNSFFYVFAHLALAFAASEAGIEALIPQAIVTNEFYQLDSFKFSTSQGHVIWGREFLEEVPTDEARFYFAWSNPEMQEANFRREDFDAVVMKEFSAPLQALSNALSAGATSSAKEVSHSDPAEAALLERFASAYDPNHPSLRLAAQTLASGLNYALARIALDPTADRVRSFSTALAIGAAPLIPGTAARLWQLAGNRGPIKWPAEVLDGTKTEWSAVTKIPD